MIIIIIMDVILVKDISEDEAVGHYIGMHLITYIYVLVYNVYDVCTGI